MKQPYEQIVCTLHKAVKISPKDFRSRIKEIIGKMGGQYS